MFKPGVLLLFFILFFSFAWLSSSGYWKRADAIRTSSNPKEYKAAAIALTEKMKSKAAEARTFIERNNYDGSVCFFVDMSLPSGQNRFSVYDLKKDTIERSGLVTHGRCNQTWLEGRKYGNTIGCGCTSIGKYRIGNSYNGRFGLAFKLYGLDKTNDKAFPRFVVLHSHSCVPESEVKDDICQSDGCPTVAPGFLQQLGSIINASKKPVLLWIYE